MSNPLRDHFERVRAERTARQTHNAPTSAHSRPMGATMTRQTAPQFDADTSEGDAEDSDLSGLELRFFNDWETLSNIQSHSTKNAKKAELLPTYKAWIDGTLAGGTGSQNDMLLKLMVWALDAQDLTTATRIAEYALLHDIVMPEPFTRSVAAVYAEQFSDEIVKNGATPDSDLVEKALDITNDHDMPDQIRAKLYRAYGNTLKDSHADDAIKAYEKAIKLDANVGCKNDLNQLKKA